MIQVDRNNDNFTCRREPGIQIEGKTSYMKSFIQLGASLTRVLVLLAVLAGSYVFAAGTPLVSGAHAAVVVSITVRGNQRVDDETIISYVTIKPGVAFSSFDTDDSIERLYSTGLFADVRINQSGRVLIVQVRENPTINLVLFEGNDKIRDEQLQGIVQSQSLGIFSQVAVDSDIERISEAIRRSGRASPTVTARIDQLDNNRVNIVFVINEGGRTKIRNINIIGNNAFSDYRLYEVISHKQSNFLSWLKRDDVYDPDRLRADEGRLRQFYFNRGYADFVVISAVADFDPVENNYTITITVEEGELYRFGRVEIDNALAAVDADALRYELEVAPGDIYSARNVERSLVAMTNAIARAGYAFAEVTPRGDRDIVNRTINITFFIDEGQRVYIERIEVTGNDRTRGYVIRREFDVSEGDAYNKVLVNQAKIRLERLGYFEFVRITTRQGSAPDRIVIIVAVKDKATGEFSIGGGYSTSGGALGEISLSERNFLGRGQFLSVTAGGGDGTRRYQLSFTEPYFYGHRIAAGFDTIYESQESGSQSNTSYDSEIYLGRIRASAPITENLRFGVDYTYKYEDVTTDKLLVDLSPATRDLVMRSPYSTSSVGYKFTYSTIDNMNKPREGIYGVFKQDFAGLGGDAEFIRTTGKISAYYLASEDADLVLMASAGAGYVYNYSSENLRITDAFYLGGETIRGFETRGLGPRDMLSGDALGGDTYYNATVEVQAPFMFIPRSYGLSAAVFADAGTLYGSDWSNDPGIVYQDSDEFRASVGVSVLWDSPFGPLRADYAYVLLEQSFDETQPFRFGVRSAF